MQRNGLAPPLDQLPRHRYGWNNSRSPVRLLVQQRAFVGAPELHASLHALANASITSSGPSFGAFRPPYQMQNSFSNWLLLTHHCLPFE